MTLLQPSSVAGRRAVPLPPPPAYLKLPPSDIHWAHRTSETPHANKRSRRSPAQRAGLAYQRKVEEYLTVSRRGGALDVGPWFVYSCHDRVRRYCQPDVLILRPGGAEGGISSPLPAEGPHAKRASAASITVCEIKLRWTPDAWWQLRKLYLPVLRAASPAATLIPLVICRSFDPALPQGEPVRFVDNEEEASPDAFNVLVLRL